MTDNDFDREVQEVIAGWRAGITEQDVIEGRESIERGEGMTTEQLAARFGIREADLAAVQAAFDEPGEDSSLEDLELELARAIVMERHSPLTDEDIAAANEAWEAARGQPWYTMEEVFKEFEDDENEVKNG